MNRIAVLGPGAVGGFLSALFWRKNLRVTCIAREPTAALIKRDGIQLDSEYYGRFTAFPRAATKLDHEPDLLVVATKATTLEAALDRIPASQLDKGVVMPLLNGIEHVDLLRKRFGPRIAPGAISVESRLQAANHVVQSSVSCGIRLASADFDRDGLESLVDLLEGVRITTEVLAEEAEVLWGKLIRLNALACVTSASDSPIGCVREDSYWYDKLKDCLVEGAAVARACGVNISLNEELAFVDRFPPDFTTSMHRDIRAGREPELDAIAGSVIRAGARHGIQCPTIRELMNRIGSISRERHGKVL